VAHQVGNGRLTQASLSEPGSERMTQIVPMQIVVPANRQAVPNAFLMSV
jgi:hypothetical protein